MDPQNKKEIYRQSSITKPCSYCGELMNVARGNIIKEIDIINGKRVIVNEFKNTDQRVFYHKKCRKEGRRLERKRIKKLNKIK